MREILFRGKSANTGEWIFGDYEHFYLSDGELVVYISKWGKRNDKVLPETVGQYTGLTDKNGKKIFEGDVIWGDDCTGTWHKGVVEYDDSIGSFIINAKRFMQYPKNENHYDLLGCWSIEGNIHDNPELLEGENDKL